MSNGAVDLTARLKRIRFALALRKAIRLAAVLWLATEIEKGD